MALGILFDAQSYEKLILSDDDRRQLQKIIRARSTPQHCVIKAQAVLAMAQGVAIKTLSEELQISRISLTKWRERYRETGTSSLGLQELFEIRPGRGRKPTVQAQMANRIIEIPCTQSPKMPPIGAVALWLAS